MFRARRTPVWDAARAHIRDPRALAEHTAAKARITAGPHEEMAVARMVVHHTAAVVRHRHTTAADHRLMVVAHTGVRRPLTVAGRQVMAVGLTAGLHPPTAVEERHRMAEAEQLHLTAVVAVAARADPAVAEDTRPLEAEVIAVAAEAEATLAADVTEPSHA